MSISSSDSKVWGPHVWYVMHRIPLAFIIENKPFTTREKRISKNFYNTIATLLPCPSCKDHYSQTLKRNPVMKNNTATDLFYWTVNAHNLANKGLGKKVLTNSEAFKIHQTPINDKHFIRCIYTLIVFSTDKIWTNRRLFAICLAELYPQCDSYEAIKEFTSKNPPRQLKNGLAVTKWGKQLVEVIQKK